MDIQQSSQEHVNRRQFLKLAGGTALGASTLLTACGSTGAGGTSSSGDVITLNHWYYAAGEKGTKEAVFRYAEEYSKVNPKVKVKVTWIPGDYFGKLNTALFSPNPPDVFELGSGSPIDQMGKAGQLAPLDDLFAQGVKDQFYPQDIRRSTVNGQIYGVQKLIDLGLLYYRKSVLDKAGVQPPTTIDELIAAAKKLTTPKMKGLFAGNDGYSALWNIALWSSGSDLIREGKFAFNNERTAKAFLKLRELYQSGSLLIGAPTDWFDPSSFITGLAAMQWGGMWEMPAIKDALGDDFGVLPWPALDAQGQPATFWGGWTEFVSAKSKYLDAAKAYVKWLWIDNTAVQQDWSLAYGFHVPPKEEAIQTAQPLQSGQAATGANIVAKYGFVIDNTFDDAMGTALSTAASNVILHNANPQSELTAAEQKCQQELTKELGS